LKLHTLLPDPSILVALAPEELAGVVLRVLKATLQNGKFHPTNVCNGEVVQYVQAIPGAPKDKVDAAVSEALHWLFVNGLTMHAPGDTFGWHVITRRAASIESEEDFRQYKQASAFPKSMIHPSISDKVWLMLARGDYEEAVFVSFRAVEIAVRDAGGFDDKDIGTQLMRKAFSTTNGPLTDQMQPEAEREALANLFVGAVGSYKNPHSHRTVTISEAAEAQEMVVMASHLLRIVDDRKSRLRP
jgi:uncharacterized protein (TIGR02391 family)